MEFDGIPGSEGDMGVQDFISAHICNDVCQALNLPEITGLPLSQSQMDWDAEEATFSQGSLLLNLPSAL
jgi:hypothetical protein